MKMIEVKVDVHAVHPTTAASRSTPRVPVTGSAYGSWCSPDVTPSHVTSPTSSNAATKAEYRDFTPDNPSSGDEQHTVRLFTKTPPPQYSSKDDIIQEAPIELEEIEKPKFKDKPSERSSPETDESKSAPVWETPQSPVPTSPMRDKKRLFRLPALCDPFVPIDPQGRRYITWLLLVTCCYSYNAWCIALRATFPYQTPANTPYWMVVDYICDVVYLLDVALVKNRLMFLHEGFWVDSYKETRRNYRKKLQFKFDVVSLAPLDILYLYFGADKVILRLPRLLKLQTFWEFHQAMDRVLSSPYVVRIGKTLFYIFYLIHLNACAYYAMSAYEGLGSNGWVYDDEGSAYIRCFYFATKTATSIGKNPKPENEAEYLFMTAAWLMGVFVFALLIGQIRDIIATATRAQAEYRQTVDGCSRYLRKLNMPTALQKRVTNWFSYTWNQQRCFDESRILDSLPYNMKRDVALEVHMSTLSKVQLFCGFDDSLLRELVLQLRPVSFLPGEVVVRRGDVGHHMYIVKSGECYVMSQEENKVLATLREGAVFGEISLLGIEGLRRRTATVRSRGYSSLFALSRSDLNAALKHHKDPAQLLRLRADVLIRENAARQTKQRIADRQARRSASTAGSGATAGKRRLSSVSSTDSAAEGRRQRSVSALSKRRLSVLSENQPQPCNASLASACSAARSPLPTIVLTSQ